MDLQIVAWHYDNTRRYDTRRSKNHYKWTDMNLTLCGRQVGENAIYILSYATCARCIEYEAILSQEELSDDTGNIIARALLGLVSADPQVYFVEGSGWHQEKPHNPLEEDTTS